MVLQSKAYCQPEVNHSEHAVSVQLGQYPVVVLQNMTVSMTNIANMQQTLARSSYSAALLLLSLFFLL